MDPVGPPQSVIGIARVAVVVARLLLFVADAVVTLPSLAEYLVPGIESHLHGRGARDVTR